MPLPNFSTTVSVERTAQEIMSILARHGATKIMAEYDGRGEITGLSWLIESPEYGSIPFKLPIRAEATLAVLKRDGRTGKQAELPHAKRVAWRILRDWIRAQMGLLETEMVRLEEIFLPYMITSGDRTVFEQLKEQRFLLGEGLKETSR